MPKYVDETGLTRFYDNIADRPVYTFDTVAEMQAATYLEDGMTCHTNGFHEAGDGGAAYYKVGASGDIALYGGLYASEVDFTKTFIDAVTADTFRVSDTDCYTVTIPLNDSNGDIIEPYMGFSTTETPAQYARNHGTTFTCNGTLNILKTDDTWQVGYFMSHGEVLYGSAVTGTPVANSLKYISVNQDRSVTEYPITATLAQLQAGNAYNVFTAYYKLVEGGTALDLSNVTANETGRVTDLNPNLAMGVKSDKTLVFFACDGRTSTNPGLDSDEVAAQMVALGCSDAWMLDGGGSTSLNYQCSKMNRNIDDAGTTDRMIRFTFNVKNDDSNELLVPTFAKIGEEKQALLKQVMSAINAVNKAVATSENVLNLALAQNDAVVTYFYNGTDTNWTPFNDDYQYGVFVVERAGLTRVVTAYKYNGLRKARITYANGHWYNWIREPYIETGTYWLSGTVAANSTQDETITILNPFQLGSGSYIAFVEPVWNNQVVTSVNSKTASNFKVAVRNVTSTDAAGVGLNWMVVYI